MPSRMRIAAVAEGTAAMAGWAGTGIAGDYLLTDRWSVRGGDRLLWIDGVALATDQVAASDFAFDRGTDPTGDVFYHGAFVGMHYVR